ncbi:HAMP domain-containing sensor histidine kinase [uncultured Gemmiger sp.]|mgnify:FL=1|uniref:sensor histidine kinase n=1 Tax=uncultured Gemmiger sp. TaxID=1623490 RepID=UPI0025CEF4E5|nr:HAMP domain-containing sensor histidine kinase [uncultured Gemmiger sp.]
MAKRRLTSLYRVLVRYLVCCGGGCVLLVLIWWSLLMALIRHGFLLSANAGAVACYDARQTVVTMTADTFDETQISDLCRWAIVENDAVTRTNMTARQLKIALNAFHGGSGNLGYTTQYQYDVKMADGSFCILAYDYSLPYADKALRSRLPDFQTSSILLLVVLLLGWTALTTARTVRRLAADTARLNRAIAQIAAHRPDAVDADSCRIREFSDTLHAMQTMGSELTDSLRSQWRLEQQRTEQLAALTHDLKTPLTIIRGNAELLAEDELTPAQTGQTDAILRACDRAGEYLAALRTVNAQPSAKTDFAAGEWLAELSAAARDLCAAKGLAFSLVQKDVPATLTAARSDVTRAVVNLLDNAVRYSPAGGRVTLTVQRQGEFLCLTVQDSGEGFTAEALQKAGDFLYTDAARPGNGHQGLGLYFVRCTAVNHGGRLVLSNTAEGGRAAMTLLLQSPGS